MNGQPSVFTDSPIKIERESAEAGPKLMKSLVWILLLPLVVECAIKAANQKDSLAEERRAALAQLGAPEPAVRRDAALRLVIIGDSDSIPYLLKAAYDQDEGVRIAAISALGKIGGEEALAAIESALTDRKPLVRRTAAFTLGQMKNPQAVGPLLEATRDREAEVRAAAANALGALADQTAEPELVRLLKDGHPVVRREAAHSLGVIRTPGAVNALAKVLLADKDNEVKRHAAWALGEISDPKALAALRAAARSADPYLNNAALQAIERIDRANAKQPTPNQRRSRR